MGTVYLSSDAPALATQFASRLKSLSRQIDPFQPVIVVVPNRNVGRWLQLHIARTNGIAINVEFEYLEAALWKLMRTAADGVADETEQIDERMLQQMILAVLLDEQAQDKAELALVRDYLRGCRSTTSKPAGSRDYYRRAWQLSSRLADSFRDYEHHRGTMLKEWRGGQWVYSRTTDKRLERMEQCQRAVYLEVFCQGGMRDQLATQRGHPLLTLRELSEHLPDVAFAEELSPRSTVAVFGLAQVSTLQRQLLHHLAHYVELDLYLLSPWAGVLEQGPAASRRKALLSRLTTAPGAKANGEDRSLEDLWGAAGVRAMRLMQPLLEDAKLFDLELVEPQRAGLEGSVLTQLQRHLLGLPVEKRNQDTSLQIIGCPSTFREIETIHNSIVRNLSEDPSLRATDVAVLVPTMGPYRAAIEAIFSRWRDKIPYNVADFSASESSRFGAALLALLDLAVGRFSRNEVCQLLSDPCFLAAYKTDPQEAQQWVGWAHELGICHSFDADDRASRGYTATPSYTWKQGLQRLRMSRILEPTAGGSDDEVDGAELDYHGVVPFADLASGDAESIGRFCLAVETLYRRLQHLRTLVASAAQWQQELRTLIGTLLAVPEQHPEEAEVRRCILEALEKLPDLDAMQGIRGSGGGIQLQLVHDYVRDHLVGLNCCSGAYVVGGVTISTMQPMRAIPFRIVYIAGLGEGNFPGRPSDSILDLRALDPLEPFDVSLPDANRGMFAERVLGTEAKLYLSYVARDLQRDQRLYSCSVINQLKRFLSREVVTGAAFEEVQVPLHGCDARYLQAEPTWSDVLVNYSPQERLTCLSDAAVAPALAEPQRKLVQQRERTARTCFVAPTGSAARPLEPATVGAWELKSFLRNPLEAALKRHLRLYEDEARAREDDEPFFTSFPADWQLLTGALTRFVRKAMTVGAAPASAEAAKDFDQLYQAYARRGRVPDGAYAEIDRATLRRQFLDRVDNGLVDFVRQRERAESHPWVLVGPSRTRCAASVKFPPLRLRGAAAGQVISLSAMVPLVWRTAETVESLVIVTGKSKDHPTHHLLEPLIGLLAVRASGAPVQGAAQQWWGKRRMTIHVACADALAEHAFGAISVKEASEYLAQLSQGLLDSNSFDLLPFDLIVADRNLRAVITEPWNPAMAREYPKMLEEAIEADAETFDRFKKYRPPELLELIPPSVPPDAYEKVRQRYQMVFRPALRGQAQTASGSVGPGGVA